MHNLNDISDSVYFLIKSLCNSILSECDFEEEVIATAVHKLRVQSISLLLKRSNHIFSNKEVDIEPCLVLKKQVFIARLHALNNLCECVKIGELEKEIDLICKEPYFAQKTGSNVVQLLIMLQNNEGIYNYWLPATKLYIPGPFTLCANNQYDQRNLVKDLKCFLQPDLYSNFKGTQSFRLAKVPCIQSGKLKEPSYLINSILAITTPNNFIENTKKAKTIDEKLFIIEKDARKSSKPYKFTWNWESLGCFGAATLKPFCCDTNVTLEIQSHQKNITGQKFIAKVLSQKQFLTDIQLLTVGIQSDSFYSDENFEFNMNPNLTVVGILPATIHDFIEEFLECGTCYKRLQTMIVKRDFKLMFDGFIFKALCNAVDDFLLIFRQFIFAEDDEQLMAFYQRTRNMFKQIINLSLTLAIHPKVDAKVKPPMGSQFLGYLYREVVRLTEKEYIALMVFILKRCCHVYFKHLQKWIFYGILDDPCDELFIGFMDHYRLNTKYYYDKAFFLRKESVPGFFQNYENQILQCGKYTMLLKEYNTNHSLFDLNYPSISVCLCFEDIQKLKNECLEFHKRALKHCGFPVTVHEIFKERHESRRNLFRIISQRSRENMEKWCIEQNNLSQVTAEKKKKLLEELSAQLEKKRMRKIAERRDNVEFALKLLKEAEKCETAELQQDNINLRKRIEYYQDLSIVMQSDVNVKNSKKEKTDTRNSNLPQTTRTPGSTDFESCDDDKEVENDTKSEYAECLSDDFIDKFSKNEEEIRDICLQDQQHLKNFESCRIQTDDDFDLNTNVKIKRSVSDVLNSNELPENSSKQTINVNLKLTEAQQNKLKVLSHEFNTFIDQVPDINLNTLPNGQLTQLQQNRKKIMEHNLFTECKKETVFVNVENERSRNRRKVLESEYDIITGQQNLSPLHAANVENVSTPMSTTSDTSITETINRATLKNDIENGNFIEQTRQLEQNEIMLFENKQEAQHIIEVVENANNTKTPAPILNASNFDSNQVSQTDTKPQSDEDVSQIDQITADNTRLHDNVPYERCAELIRSNFKCSTRTSYFRLNKLNTQTTNEEILQKLEQVNVDCMSIIRLTDFLQKSVTIPMGMYLELLNNEVMRLFLKDLCILDHFRSLRHYFFLMDGEFGAIICEGIIGKLEDGAAPEKLLNYQMLHSILDAAVGSSIKGRSKNAENLSFIVHDIPESFDLLSPSVLNTLSLSYRINWPLNLILNPETIEQYGNIFRYLLKVRRISLLLERSYQILKEAVKKHGYHILQSPQYRYVQRIRHKLYHFVLVLQNHITANALQASWKTFQDDLIQATSIEDIYRKHTAYIKRILFLCMLNRRSVDFFNKIDSIFKITLRFYNNLKSREFKLRSNEKHFTHSRYELMVNDEQEFDKFIKYTIYLGNKIVRHGYQAEIGEFINLINYNQYYMSENI